MKVKNLAIWVFLLALVVLLQGAGHQKEAEQDLKLYCEMVEIRQTSNDPNLGWPDYKGIYASQCGD